MQVKQHNERPKDTPHTVRHVTRQEEGCTRLGDLDERRSLRQKRDSHVCEEMTRMTIVGVLFISLA